MKLTVYLKDGSTFEVPDLIAMKLIARIKTVELSSIADIPLAQPYPPGTKILFEGKSQSGVALLSDISHVLTDAGDSSLGM